MSGIVSAAYNLARQQAVEGWEVDLIGLASQHLRTGDAYWAHGLRVMPVRPWHWCRVCSYDFRYLAPLTASLQRESPADVHQVYSNPYLLVPGRAAKRVIRYSTPIGEVPKAYSRALQRADAVICCSGFIRDQFVGRVTYPEGRVYVVRGGVDLGVFQPGNRHASREWLKIDPGDTVILFAGQVNEEKGLLHVVRACRQLSRDYDLHLMVAGSSSLWGSIDNPNEWMAYERRVVEEASALRASLLGRVPHGRMPAVYQAADIFVCPSVWDDPLPRVCLEAMATGLPVVATSVGGTPEVVAHEVTGLLVPPADPEALAAALRRLLDSPALARRLGEEGLRRVQRFGWQSVARRVAEIYASTP